jgi:hypothetical protein
MKRSSSDIRNGVHQPCFARFATSFDAAVAAPRFFVSWDELAASPCFFAGADMIRIC